MTASAETDAGPAGTDRACGHGPGPCGAVPARLYPAGWRCAAHAPSSGVVPGAAPPGARTRRLSVPGPCRLCRAPAWGADEAGPVHDCCLAWQHVIAAGYPCPACQIAAPVLRQLAKMAAKAPDERRAVRLPVLPPLPVTLPDGTPFVPDPGPHGRQEEPPVNSPSARRPGPAGHEELRNAALSCAARGWHVFPVTPRAKKPPAFPAHKAELCDGTDPRCRNGHVKWEQRATTDPARITRAWSHVPYNIGIAPGPSGLIVIDLDVPHPGEEPPPRWRAAGICDGADVLAVLCEEHGQAFPWETFTARTRRGGWHLYFQAPPGTRLGNTSGKEDGGLGWKIDTRAHGGYVLAPGSFADLPDGTGCYEVAYDRPPAPLPGWLAALLTAPRPQSPPLACHPGDDGQVRDLPRYVTAALNKEGGRVASAVEGGRNAALNKAAYHLGQLITAGVLDDATAERELYAAASVHFGIGHPPFMPADALATIRSAIAAGKQKPRALGAAA